MGSKYINNTVHVYELTWRLTVTTLAILDRKLDAVDAAFERPVELLFADSPGLLRDEILN